MANEYKVTVKITALREYYITARDYEYAEDYAIDEAFKDNFKLTDADVSVEIYESEPI